MTDERPINAWCRKYLEYLENEREPDCLLDIIQDHETMQLNSMLDEECRAILRSIHEGYKKIHVYKGQ